MFRPRALLNAGRVYCGFPFHDNLERGALNKHTNHKHQAMTSIEPALRRSGGTVGHLFAKLGTKNVEHLSN